MKKRNEKIFFTVIRNYRTHQPTDKTETEKKVVEIVSVLLVGERRVRFDVYDGSHSPSLDEWFCELMQSFARSGFCIKLNSFLSGGCNLEFSPAIAPQIHTSIVDQVLLHVRFQPAGFVDSNGTIFFLCSSAMFLMIFLYI